jgi:hypothetical protein
MEQLKTINVHGKEYVEVKTRVQYFRKNYPNGSIVTDVLQQDSESITTQTKIFIDDKLVSSGIAHEDKNVSHINKTSFIECCETSSVGRALGLFGIGIEASVDTADTIRRAIDEQNANKKVEDLLNYKAEQLGIQLFNAINEDDEDSIAATVSEMRGDKTLAEKIYAGLSVEHAEYMDERKTRMAEERKAKSAEKAARNKQAAEEYAASKSA